MRTILFMLFLASLAPIVLCVDLVRWMACKFRPLVSPTSDRYERNPNKKVLEQVNPAPPERS